MRFTTHEGVLRIPNPKSNLFSYFATPEEAQASGLGRLFIIVEIQNRERKNIALGPECIAILKDSFYHSPSSDSEASLELACQKLNQWAEDLTTTPANITKKISITVLALKDDFVVFSAVNQGKIYLIRHGKLIDLFPQSKGAPKQLSKKIFSNLTSGLLEDEDVLMASSHSLFDYLSESAVKEMIARLDPSSAAVALSSELKKLTLSNGLEGIIVKLHRESESLPATSLQQDIQSPRTLSSLESLKQKEMQTNKFITPPSSERMKQIIKSVLKTQEILRSTFSYWRKRLLNAEKSTQSQISTPLLQSQERTQPSSQPFHEGKTLVDTPPSQKLSLPRQIPEIHNRSWRYTVTAWIKKRQYLVMGGILISAFIISILFRFSSISIFTPNRVSLLKTQIIEALENADAALIYDNRVTATTEIKNALTLFLELTEKQRAKEQTLGGRITGLQRKLFRITTPSWEIAVDFSQSSDIAEKPLTTGGIFTANGTLYAYQSTPAEIFEISLAKKTVTVYPISRPDASPLLSAHADDGLALVTSAQTALLFSLKEKTNEPISLPTSVQSGMVYAGRIYLLTPSSIIKLTKSGTPPVWKQASWIEDGTTFSNASGMAIDGNIYVATPEGLNKFSKGKKVAFLLEETDLVLVPTLVSTTLESASLYLWDATHHRMVITTKEGKIIQQLDLSGIETPLTSFVVDELKKIIYLHTDNKLLRVSF